MVACVGVCCGGPCACEHTCGGYSTLLETQVDSLVARRRGGSFASAHDVHDGSDGGGDTADGVRVRDAANLKLL